MTRPSVIGLDADDALWHNQTLLRLLQARFDALLQTWADPPVVAHGLAAVARRKRATHGYGAKGFMLPMRETAASHCRCGRRPSR